MTKWRFCPGKAILWGVTRLRFLLWLLAGFPLFLGAQTTSPPLLTVYFSERPPLCILDGQRGVLLELTKAFLADAGLKARFIELPPNRVLDLLRSGQGDALGVGWFKTPERELWGRFSRPIYQDRPLVAVVNSRVVGQLPYSTRLDALLSSGLTLGLQTGVSLGVVVDQKIRALGLVPLESVVDTPTLLHLIRDGRMDYTLMSQEEAEYLLAQDAELGSGLVLVKLVDAPQGNVRHLLYSVTFEPEVATRIDAAIDRIRSSGRYRALIEQD